MPKGSRAIPARKKQIAELVQERQEAVKRNSSLRLHTRKSLAEAIGWKQSTVRDDIRDMRADGQPIKFDTSRKGYVYTEKFAPVPTTCVTESDLAQLCLGIRSLEALKGTPLYKPIQKALDKMTRGLIDEFGINFEALKSTVTFRSTGVDALTDPAVIETLMHAINRREELEIVYSKLNQPLEGERPREPLEGRGGGGEYEAVGDGREECPHEPHLHPGIQASVPDACEQTPPGQTSPDNNTVPAQSDHPLANASSPPVNDAQPLPTIPFPNAPWLQLPVETRIAHPLHILCQDNAWYLWLWDPVRKDKNRSFSLSRIRSITRTGKTFRPRKFDINQELTDTFGITSGKPVDVKIHFRRKASYLVAERPWHHSMKLAPGPDAEWNLELTMHVAITPELIKWIMGYDEDARVIESAELADLIAAKAAGIAANYAKPHS